MKLTNDIVQVLNNMSIDGVILKPGLGDMLQYILSSYGANEQIVPPVDEETGSVKRPSPTAYQAGEIGQDADFLYKHFSETILLLQQQIQKEHEVCSHTDIMKMLLALDTRVNKLENP